MPNIPQNTPPNSPELAPDFSLPFGGNPSPWAQPNIWDAFYASGVPWVGKVEVRGAVRSFKWDVKPAPGIEGFNQSYRGKPHKPFHIVFYIWTDSMYVYWESTYQKLFMYSGGAGVVVPVKCYHPSLSGLGITALVADEVGAVEKLSDDMMYAATLTVHEFYPPVPTNATATPVAAAGVNPHIPGFPSPSAEWIRAQQELAQARTAAALATALP
jgi:hypothetical protein